METFSKQENPGEVKFLLSLSDMNNIINCFITYHRIQRISLSNQRIRVDPMTAASQKITFFCKSNDYKISKKLFLMMMHLLYNTELRETIEFFPLLL